MESDGFVEYGSINHHDDRSPRSSTHSPRMNNLFSSTGSLSSLMIPPSSVMRGSNSTNSFAGSTGKKLSQTSLGDSTATIYDTNEENEEKDEARIQRAMHETGRRAFGIVAIDVWLLDQSQSFVHATLWIHPVFRRRHPSYALDRLLYEQHPAYATPVPQVPGAGLAGYFWSLGLETTGTTTSKAQPPLVWRDLKAITSDPFQPPYQRMSVLEEAGFAKATGVPFNILGHRGVVVFLARESASETLLNQPSNMEYLRFAAQHIGATSALTAPRQRLEVDSNLRKTKTARRVAAKMTSVSAFLSLRRTTSNKSLRSLASSSSSLRSPVLFGGPTISQHREPSILLSWSRRLTARWLIVQSLVQERVQLVVKKTQGSNLQPPPPAPLLNSMWTFCGAFITLQTLFLLSAGIRHINTNSQGIVLAPFGALLTLQFSLTAAPASQPRSILYGQLVSMTIALIAQRQLSPWLPTSVLVPLATATAIATMTKIGCSHPPAAAAVVALFAQKEFTLASVALLLLGNGVAVLLSVLINNVSEQRQYPVYWALGDPLWLQGFCSTARRKLDPQEYTSVKEEYSGGSPKSVFLSDDYQP